jgi:hypothetical protein
MARNMGRYSIEGTVDEDVVFVAASGDRAFGYALLRAADFTARRMRARPIEVFLPEDFSTRPFEEALRAVDFLAAITGSVMRAPPAAAMGSAPGRGRTSRKQSKRRRTGIEPARELSPPLRF